MVSSLWGKAIMIFFTSDHHFSHNNIIRYCQRPFSSVEEMDQEMIHRWNETVAPEDTVYYLGDFSLSLKPVESVTPLLHGKKLLIMGNHDVCHPFNKKRAARGREVYFKSGFESLELESSIEIAGRTVLLHHLPYLNPSVTDKYGSTYDPYRPKDKGQWLLCGHVHQNWLQQERMINVGVDVWDFYPVPITKIENLMNV
jgi:calcineurin-like phosphoesterase family protein